MRRGRLAYNIRVDLKDVGLDSMDTVVLRRGTGGRLLFKI